MTELGRHQCPQMKGHSVYYDGSGSTNALVCEEVSAGKWQCGDSDSGISYVTFCPFCGQKLGASNAAAASVAKGKLIVFEGLDHTGKSTQIALAEAWMKVHDISSVRFREPGGTKLGERIRELLLDRSEEILFETEMMLFFASRVQLADEQVNEALDTGTTVLLDRYYFSTAAYQGQFLSQGMGFVLRLAQDLKLPEPDLVICLDGDPELLAKRHTGPSDRIEAKGVEYQKNVRRGYHELAKTIPTIRLIDAARPPEQVAADIAVHLAGAFK